VKVEFEVPASVLVTDEDFFFPYLDFDEDIPVAKLKKRLKPFTEQHRLGPYLLIKTRKGYRIMFTHDTDREYEDVEAIIYYAVKEGLCDEKFYEVGRVQKWRGCRTQGKYLQPDLKYISLVDTGYVGRPNNISYMLDAMFERLCL
jgi:hypothetical protein